MSQSAALKAPQETLIEPFAIIPLDAPLGAEVSTVSGTRVPASTPPSSSPELLPASGEPASTSIAPPSPDEAGGPPHPVLRLTPKTTIEARIRERIKALRPYRSSAVVDRQRSGLKDQSAMNVVTRSRNSSRPLPLRMSVALTSITRQSTPYFFCSTWWKDA